jgi:glycosyltransferase involved in cell wall biosynthesis
MPRVTIGMPLYNGGPWLDGALSSILAQTFSDFELIISDNASTDDGPATVRAWAERDRRISLRTNVRNLGAAANYNVLVDLARGEYFKWAAHDDILMPGYLARCVEQLDRRPDAVLSYPTTVMIDERGEPTGEDPYDVGALEDPSAHERLRVYMERAWPRSGCNAVFGLIRTDALRATRMIGGYASSDKILLAELALLGKFDQTSDPFFLRREHLKSSVRANPDIKARNLWFDSSGGGQSRFIRWKWIGEYIRGISHVPLAAPERMRCLWELRRHIRREERHLTAELKMPVKVLLSRLGLRKGARA